MSDTGDFFRGRIDQMIDLRHPLAVLSARIPWQEIEASLAQQFARGIRDGQRVEGTDLVRSEHAAGGRGRVEGGPPAAADAADDLAAVPQARVRRERRARGRALGRDAAVALLLGDGLLRASPCT